MELRLPILFSILAGLGHAFLIVAPSTRSKRRSATLKEKKESMSYDDTDASSKGLVSSMTNIVNLLSFNKSDSNEEPEISTTTNPAPKTPNELLERIQDDYVVRNYLWTGDIDLAAFDPKCRFTDPTLSFEGTHQFVKNLSNLVPIVNALIEPGGCKSDLLNIELNEEKGYVQSRWNMVGRLTGLPWSPTIDVVSTCTRTGLVISGFRFQFLNTLLLC